MQLECVRYIGASRRTGKAKASGNPYDICVVKYSVPLRPVSRENMSFSGFGEDVYEIPLDPDAINKFQGFESGSIVNLHLSMDPENPQKNRCCGVEAP